MLTSLPHDLNFVPKSSLAQQMECLQAVICIKSITKEDQTKTKMDIVATITGRNNLQKASKNVIDHLKIYI